MKLKTLTKIIDKRLYTPPTNKMFVSVMGTNPIKTHCNGGDFIDLMPNEKTILKRLDYEVRDNRHPASEAQSHAISILINIRKQVEVLKKFEITLKNVIAELDNEKVREDAYLKSYLTQSISD